MPNSPVSNQPQQDVNKAAKMLVIGFIVVTLWAVVNNLTYSPNHNDGTVVVAFQEVPYMQAEELLTKLNVREYTNNNWPQDYIPESQTRLTPDDIFEIKVKPDAEAQIVEKLNAELIVRIASEDELPEE